jgi:hypothetical protein
LLVAVVSEDRLGQLGDVEVARVLGIHVEEVVRLDDHDGDQLLIDLLKPTIHLGQELVIVRTLLIVIVLSETHLIAVCAVWASEGESEVCLKRVHVLVMSLVNSRIAFEFKAVFVDVEGDVLRRIFRLQGRLVHEIGAVPGARVIGDHVKDKLHVNTLKEMTDSKLILLEVNGFKLFHMLIVSLKEDTREFDVHIVEQGGVDDHAEKPTDWRAVRKAAFMKKDMVVLPEGTVA